MELIEVVRTNMDLRVIKLVPFPPQEPPSARYGHPTLLCFSYSTVTGGRTMCGHEYKILGKHLLIKKIKDVWGKHLICIPVHFSNVKVMKYPKKVQDVCLVHPCMLIFVILKPYTGVLLRKVPCFYI